MFPKRNDAVLCDATAAFEGNLELPREDFLNDVQVHLFRRNVS